MIPQLKQEAQTDGKTGLWNARHFTKLFTAEMERAQRFNRPLTVIMADLDLLRNINNTYGHLAGDIVLSGIGQIIKENIREYDIAGRFGGEEFAIVLPETGPAEAQALAERLRAAVEVATFQVATSQTPISCTMSIGVACCPWDATTVTELIHEADVAVYQAKLRGRNCVICAADVPHSVKLEHAPSGERVSSPYNGSFSPRPVQPRAIPQAPAHSTTEEEYAVVANNAQVASVAVAATGKNEKHPEEHADRPPTGATTVQLHDIEEDPAKSGPAQSQAPAAQKPASDPVGQPGWAMWTFIITVTLTGIALAVMGVMTAGTVDWTAVALLTGLAVGAELLQVDVYGDNTVSVSVALAFAVALIAGLPGMICISAAIALSHYILVKPALYKTPVNWATHLLAGSMPALVMMALPVPLVASNLLLLALPLAAAALAYYALETGIISVAISLSRGINVVATWQSQFRWLANHYLVLCMMGAFLSIAYTALGPVGVMVFALPIVMMRYSQKQYVDRTEDSMKELKRMNQELTHANREVVLASKALGQLNEELFFTLAKIIDARDPYVSGHASKVSDYAMAIATELKLPTDIMEPLRQAGFLHDIGKIGISEEILQKPAKLTPEEYEIMKTHAPLGGEFLETCGALRHLAPFVRHHHEWWNGKGYPDNLEGEEIPLESRILSVCDAAEAMASDRPYRKGMSLPEIIAEIERCAGTQFDPVVAAAFVRVAEREREHLVINSAHEVLRKQANSLKAGAQGAVPRPSLEKELPALTMG
jgi:diguanylate cyclase (GGDEF)-like protein